MQITRVELKNIKNHAEAAFSFGPGVIAICGPNGAGKTTIIEAIAWALFDHLEYNRDDFLRRGAKKGQVAVSFISSLDQREYVITRDTAGGYFVYDPVVKARLIEQKNQVVPFLRQHLGVPPDTDLSSLFKSTIGVPQGAFTYDFLLAAAPRKKIFDQILRVEEYRQAADYLKEVIRLIDARINEVDVRLAAAEGELKRYDEVQRQYDEVSARLQTLETERQQSLQRRDELTETLAALDQLQRRIREQRNTQQQLRLRHEAAQERQRRADSALSQAQKAAEILEKVRPGYDRWLEAAKTLAALEEQRNARDTLRQRHTQTEREWFSARLQMERAHERLAEIADARLTLDELCPQIARQEEVESQQAQLLESRGQAQGLRHSLDTLNQELVAMRSRYSDVSQRLETAQAQQEKALQAETLEDERRKLDQEISDKQAALNQYRVKQDLLEQLRAELKRIQEQRDACTRELQTLEPLQSAPQTLTEAEARQGRETETLARLKAEVARDTDMIASLESGALCPLLTEKCLNLKPGESLDHRFRSGLDERRGEIATLEASVTTLVKSLKKLRKDVAEAARIPRLREEEERLNHSLSAQQQRLAALETEIAPGAAISESDLKTLQNRRPGLEALLRDARAAQRQYSQAEPLQQELEQVKKEGAARKKQHEDLTARLQAFENVESQIAALQTELNALQNPRARAAALQQQIAREPEWRQSEARAQHQVTEIGAQLETINQALQEFVLLDTQFAEAQSRRAASEADHQAFLANEREAALLPEREADLAAITTETSDLAQQLSAIDEALHLSESQYDGPLHEQTRAQLENTRQLLTQILTQAEHTQTQFTQLEEQMNSLNEARERLRLEMAARQQAVKLRETADFIRDILSKSAPFITESWLLSISQEARQLYREISGNFAVTLNWTKDYEITLEEEGRERPFISLSGGEQMTAALAMRLALLRQLSEVNIAFFDEPTVNMDEDRRHNLAQQIGRISAFEQLFVISHDDSFESYTDQVVSLRGESS